ncbi:MAG: aminodeoxychorismate synthase component I [Comamonas sp.]|uniref:aminodeoxychorismate synthase component I n=1 Tax=Comamonas sp. TaxID=34028 RepID=UPI002FC8DE54
MDTRIDFTLPQGAAGAAEARLRMRFGTPHSVWIARAPGEVRAVLDAAETAARAGAWCLGFVRYEAAAAFDPALVTHAADGPLAWFAAYSEALPWDDGDAALPQASDAARVEWRSTLTRADFDVAMAQIHEAIAGGAFYQVNYTAPLRGELLQGRPQALFDALLRAQPGGYAACLDTGEEQVLSVSPELFFDWDGERILARPMKGTAPRGDTPEQDAALAQALRSAPKERAENVMVVDLLRNDLSRIAQPFSVKVPRLFHTQALPSVWQMTSDVQAVTRSGTRLTDVFSALFPCGSITGAPKVAAMQMIHALEPHARGVYCGALGVLRPTGAGRMHATFNVPIRTVVLRGSEAVCGIGSGITSGAQADGEWREWLHKSAFVERASAPFALLETLALEDGVWRHLPEHLQRLQDAAAHFAYPWSGRVAQSLAAVAAAHPSGLWRVRLQLDAQGEAVAEAFACASTPAPVRLQLAAAPLQDRWAHGQFVRYKTTRRAHYEAFTPSDPLVFDTLLFNEQREITECTRGNIAALIDGRWITPPLACGLLPGVGRAVALRAGRVREGVLHLDDVPRVEAWAFLNSLRGWLAAELESAPQP